MTRYQPWAEIVYCYISHIRTRARDMYIIFHITLNFTARYYRARTGRYIYLDARAAINSIIYLCVMYVRFGY